MITQGRALLLYTDTFEDTPQVMEDQLSVICE